MRNGYTS